MSRKPRFILLTVLVSFLLPIAAAQGVTYYWDADYDAGNGVNGGTGTWNTTLKNWYDGVSADVAWPNTQSPRVDASFGGTAGTVTTGGNLYAGALNFDTAGYILVINGGNQLYIMSLGGSQLSGTTIKGNGSNQRLWFDDAVNPVTFDGILDLSGTGGLLKQGPGTLVLDPASVVIPATAMGTGISIYAGTVILNGTAGGPSQVLSVGAINARDCTTSTAQSVLGGTGTWYANYIDVFERGRTVGGALAGVLAPGDPASNSGIGTLTVYQYAGNPDVRFNGADQADCASIFRVQVASATSYDQLVVGNQGVKLNWNSKTYSSILDLTVFPTFSGGSVGDFMKLIDITTTANLTGTFQNIPLDDNIEFTNNAGTGYRFQVKYNFDPAEGAAQNDFGLLIDEIVTADAGGAYSIDAGGEALSGSITGGTAATWAWDFDNNGVADKTEPNPFVDLAYFTGTFGWAGGSTHTIKLTVTDVNDVTAWDTTDLTLAPIPEPGTWALMGTGVLLGIGFLRRRRMK